MSPVIAGCTRWSRNDRWSRVRTTMGLVLGGDVSIRWPPSMKVVPLGGVGRGGLLRGCPGRRGRGPGGAERAGAEQRAADHRAGAEDGRRDPEPGGVA